MYRVRTMSQRVPRYHKAGLALSDRCCFAHHVTSLLNTAENGEVALCKVPGAPFPPPAALGVAARALTLHMPWSA